MASGLFLTSMRGSHGQIVVPSLGAVIGLIEPPKGQWTLRRHEDGGPTRGSYHFHAVFSFVNHELWERFSTKEIIITVSRTKRYRLEVVDGGMALEGRSLRVEGVDLWPLN